MMQGHNHDFKLCSCKLTINDLSTSCASLPFDQYAIMSPHTSPILYLVDDCEIMHARICINWSILHESHIQMHDIVYQTGDICDANQSHLHAFDSRPLMTYL